MSDIFHSGERAIQERTGERQRALANARLLWSSIPSHVHSFVGSQTVCVVGAVSKTGAIWAEFIVGAPGFASPNSDGTSVQLTLDPSALLIRDALAVGRHIGMLFIDLETRKRLRVNGVASEMRGHELIIDVDQAYPNCPKYIQTRRVTSTEVLDNQQKLQRGQALTVDLTGWITQSDMFFVASAALDGQTDVSHRGGNPGFVSVSANTLLVPDYPGNSMFSTLGNFAVRPDAGLVFVDFEQRRMLQLTGSVELDLDSNEQMFATGDTGRWWRFIAHQWVVSSLGNALRSEPMSASPFNLPLISNMS